MKEPTLGNPQNTIEVLQKYNFSFQKKFGQNFLIDTHVLDKIIQSANITEDDMVLEIGPGIGTMTQYLAQAAGKVIAVEIDKNLIPILEDTLSGYDNVRVINEDVLKLDLKKLADEENNGKPVKVVANLPYYITTPIIMGLFENEVPVESITVMVQKEVADRMQTGPGNKDYGALSLAVQYYADPYIVANVPPNCFMPRPKVGSAVSGQARRKRAAQGGGGARGQCAPPAEGSGGAIRRPAARGGAQERHEPRRGGEPFGRNARRIVRLEEGRLRAGFARTGILPRQIHLSVRQL